MITVRNRERFNDLFWGPWAELDRFQRELDHFFFGNGRATQARSDLPLNLYSNEERAQVQAIVPGFSRDELSLSIEGNVLTLSGRRTPDEESASKESGLGAVEFERHIRLPFAVDEDAVQARLNDGVLEVSLPRAEADKPRRIQIAA